MAQPSNTAGINFADVGLSGPSFFAAAGPEQTLNLPIGSAKNVSISGGVILSNETFMPAGDPSMYATASQSVIFDVGKGLTDPITISFASPVTEFSVEVFNGLTTNDTFTLTDNKGDSTSLTLQPNYLGGVGTFVLPNTHNATSFTIGSSSTDAWDFSIDNIDFVSRSHGQENAHLSHLVSNASVSSQDLLPALQTIGGSAISQGAGTGASSFDPTTTVTNMLMPLNT